MTDKSMPIGVIDSGVGGISVLRELVSLMPNEKYIYFGDSANAPYGTKTHEKILQIVEKNADYLAKRSIKALVVACNTATSVCIDELRRLYPDMPVIGIEPALKPAVAGRTNPTVIVMATPLTLKEEKFARLCESYSKTANIIPLPCPGLMELVEKGITEGAELEGYLKEHFAENGIQSADCVVLGCTHYPFVKDTIKKLLPGAEIFDGGEGTAHQVKRLLERKNLLSDEKCGSVEFENSLGGEKIIDLCKKLLAK